jgi:hypothetical protein
MCRCGHLLHHKRQNTVASDFSFFYSSEPSPKHRMCVVSASNPNMGAYKPILITAGAENYSLVAIQRPYHVAKSTTCARAAQVAAPKQVPDSAVVAPNALNPRIWAPWNTSKAVEVLGFGASRLQAVKIRWASGRRVLRSLRCPLCWRLQRPPFPTRPPNTAEHRAPMYLDISLARCKGLPNEL